METRRGKASGRGSSSSSRRGRPLLLRCVDVVLILLVSLAVVLADAAGPHPHQGVVKPFASGDPGVKLDGGALQTLKSGKPYKTQIQSGTSGRALCVQDVAAPVGVVWDRILDFNSYNKMVPKTAESSIYKTENLRANQKRIWVRMKVGFPMLKLQFFINHLYDPAKNSLTWTLDYSKKSDLDDSVGFWYVIPHPDNPEHWTRVYYSVEVSMFAWVPKFVVDFMSKQALTDATAWVKKHSELRAPQLSVEQQQEGVPLVPSTKKRFSFFGGRSVSRDQVTPDGTAVVEEGSIPEEAVVAPTSKIGLTRYGLVSSVVVLVLYNVHLYLSS